MGTITIDRAVLEQVLKALDSCTSVYDWSYSMDGDMQRFDRYAVNTAFTSLREALNAPSNNAPVSNVNGQGAKVDAQPERLGGEWTPCVKLPVVVHVRHQREGETHISTREGITPVNPDDLIMRGVFGEEYPIGRDIFERTYRLEALAAPQPQPQPQPVAWMQDTTAGLYVEPQQDKYHTVPLYTAPPRREWVPLTDAEIENLQIVCIDPVDANGWGFLNRERFARAIEAALKERNT